MNVYVDLDGVLLDTARFVMDFKALLRSLGVPATMVDRYYSSTIEGARRYRSRTYYLIANKGSIGSIVGSPEVSNTADAIDCFIDRLPEYLYGDAISFLESLPTENSFLVTYGGLELQLLKIERTGLRRYFREIAITGGGLKTDALVYFRERGLIEDFSGFFVDDRGPEIDRIKTRFPRITALLVHRPGGKCNDEPCDKQDYIVSDLVEAGSIINQESR